MQEAFIIDAVRVPRAKLSRSGSAYEALRPVDLLAPLFDALQRRNSLDGNHVEDVVLGCNTQVEGQGANIAKVAALYAGFGDQVSGATVNRFCCSGLDAINLAASKLMAGMEHLVVAGGVEQISKVPMFSDKGDWFSEPQVMRKSRFMHMGLSADLIASQLSLSREQLDDYAARSHQRASVATREGYFAPGLVPVNDDGLLMDDAIREQVSQAQLAALPASFGDALAQARPMLSKAGITLETALHSAGNSPALVDGASLVLLASRQACEHHQLKPRARLKHFSNASGDPVVMLTGHILATQKLLKATGLKPGDIDLWEINESFAASVMNYQQQLGIDDEILNVNGGAIAMGHPLGATGGILLGTLLDEMERRDVKRGVLAIPGGAGVGVATLIERD